MLLRGKLRLTASMGLKIARRGWHAVLEQVVVGLKVVKVSVGQVAEVFVIKIVEVLVGIVTRDDKHCKRDRWDDCHLFYV